MLYIILSMTREMFWSFCQQREAVSTSPNSLSRLISCSSLTTRRFARLRWKVITRGTDRSVGGGSPAHQAALSRHIYQKAQRYQDKETHFLHKIFYSEREKDTSSACMCDSLTVLGVNHGAEGAGVLLAEECAFSAQEHVAHHQSPLKAHPLPPPKRLQRRHCTIQ